jgi:hypothetical protein
MHGGTVFPLFAQEELSRPRPPTPQAGTSSSRVAYRACSGPGARLALLTRTRKGPDPEGNRGLPGATSPQAGSFLPRS